MLLEYLDVDWGWSEQQPGKSNDSFPPPFPHLELLLSQTALPWNHSGHLCQAMQLSAPVKSLQLIRGKLLPGRWRVMPDGCVRGTGSHQGAQQQQEQTPRCCLPAEVTSSCSLLQVLPWRGAGRVMAAHSQSQEQLPCWESSSSQHP